MVRFTAIIRKFDKQGEKTGWTYVEVPAELAEQLKPNNKKAFRVKGKLDKHSIEGVSLLPMGGGDFIIPINGAMRKAIGKGEGAMLTLNLQVDENEYQILPDLLDCLADDPIADQNFKKLAPSHQKYYSKWIESAKTDATRTKRIALTVMAMARGIDYGELMRSLKEEKEILGQLKVGN